MVWPVRPRRSAQLFRRAIRARDAARDVRGVIVDPLNRAGVRQRRAAHGLDVEPLVRRAPERPVVEVEAVDIDDGAYHEDVQVSRRPLGLAPETAFGPAARRRGVTIGRYADQRMNSTQSANHLINLVFLYPGMSNQREAAATG